MRTKTKRIALCLSNCIGDAARIFLSAAIASFLLAQTAFAADSVGTARLIRERRGHTAIPLGSGKVLIAGGENASGVLSDVEIFDAGSRTFSAAARLLTPRADHTASRLADGRVLLIGGRGDQPLVSTEFYDPGSGVFSAGPSLNCARLGHTATLLADGRLVVIGGDPQGTAEIFDPGIGAFVELPTRLLQARSFHASARLTGGRILVAGGLSGDGAPLRSAEILDSEALTFSPATNAMLAARSSFATRVLPDGKVQAIGGDAEGTMELFNPAGGYFTSLGHLGGTSASEAAAMRSPGRAAVIGRAAPLSLDSEALLEGENESPRLIWNLLDRTGHSLTEIPEANQAIAAGGVSSSGQYQPVAVLFSSSSATVTTDKTDYSPGETVIITGTGWQPGETVDLNIHRDNNNPPDTLLHAVADAEGNIRNDEFVVQESDVGVTFVLTATGRSSGYTAQTTFTDGNLQQVTLTPTTRTISQGSSTTYTATVQMGGNADPCTVTLTVDPVPALPPGSTATFSPNPTTTTNANFSSTLTITTAPVTAPGTYPFVARATEGPNCNSPNGTTTANGTLIVDCTGQASGTTCRPSTGVCDPAETCDGVSSACPPDALAPSGTVCRAGTGDLCNPDETCTGSSAACPTDMVAAAGTVCRASAGSCDAAESCAGGGAACPANTFQPATTTCRASAGVCDLTEQCTGTSATCPADSKSTAECRPSAGICDLAESCDGTNNDCPADAFQGSSFECRASEGVCDPAENCTGSAAACPADAKSTAVCRPAAGDCDVAEICDGVNNACPTDAFEPSSTVCRPAAGVCDAAEQCTGMSANCPADIKKGPETTCRTSEDECDLAEVCSGSSDECPADAVKPADTPCTDDNNICTRDVCDGSAKACTHPAGNAGTVCRASAGVCDLTETCTGTDADCPPDAKSTAECRPATGECDVAENCDGSSNDCPADAVKPADTACTDDANVCTRDVCDGADKVCTHPAGNAGTVCRASAGDCDVEETCTGTSSACPADALKPATTQCRAPAGVCDAAENCTGTTAACPADVKKGPETTCRESTGECDVAEVCSGSSDDCPTDLVKPPETPCTDDNNDCTRDVCDGSSKACTHPPTPFGTPCEDENICDGIETCDGSGTCQQGIPQECKATGGGQIDGLAEITILRGTNVGGRANFGFNAQLGAGESTATGHLTYIDHAMNKKVKSISVDTLVIIGNTAIFTGTATVNGAGPFEFEVRVQDWGEPGSSAAVTPDDFSISVDGYTAFGFLIAGNIQVHGSP